MVLDGGTRGISAQGGGTAINVANSVSGANNVYGSKSYSTNMTNLPTKIIMLDGLLEPKEYGYKYIDRVITPNGSTGKKEPTTQSENWDADAEGTLSEQLTDENKNIDYLHETGTYNSETGGYNNAGGTNKTTKLDTSIPAASFQDYSTNSPWSGKGALSAGSNNTYLRDRSGLNATCSSNELRVVRDVEVNGKKTDLYYAGMFSINHFSSSFSGITGITVQGYNKKGNQVTGRTINLLGWTDAISSNNYNAFSIYSPKLQNKNVTVEDVKNNGGTINSLNDLYYDKGYTAEGKMPTSGSGFAIVVEDPNKGISEDSDKYIVCFGITVTYQWMECGGSYTEYSGVTVADEYHPEKVEGICPNDIDDNEDNNGKPCTNGCCEIQWVNYGQVTQKNDAMQKIITVDYWSRCLECTASCKQDYTKIKAEMELGGYVWQDQELGKNAEYDGAMTFNNGKLQEKVLENIKVTLYEENGTIAKLTGDTDLDKNQMHRTNPTLTDKNGYYEFSGLNPMKKYYVQFEYNGQIYQPTDYLRKSSGTYEAGKTAYKSVSDMVNAKEYTNSTNGTKTIWDNTSKGVESDTIRNNFNQKFLEIGSSPKGYEVTNFISDEAKKHLTQEGNKYYNNAYSYESLIGSYVDANGQYQVGGAQLIDGQQITGYQNGTWTYGTWKSGEISNAIYNFAFGNGGKGRYPNDSEMKTIYQQIANAHSNDPEIWNKLQYIYDIQMSAYTSSPSQNGQKETYPVYDNFTIGEMQDDGNGGKVPQISKLYAGQYRINLGLWARPQTDIALIKDVFSITTKVNNETEVYANNNLKKNNYQMTLRIQDYGNFYGPNLERKLYPSDYNYNAQKTNGTTNGNLEVYVTYRIAVSNESLGGINVQIPEIVDYYDKDYTLQRDLSWIMTSDQFTSKDMWAIINANSLEGKREDGKDNQLKGKNINIAFSDSSKYGQATQTNLNKYNKIYIQGLKDTVLSSSSGTKTAYVYLTFKVNKDANGHVLLDNSDYKNNYAEINGYQTYYKDGAKLPNGVTIKGNTTVAGIVDSNSIPGNLSNTTVENVDKKSGKLEHQFENDTDRAQSVKILLDNSTRELSGIVWEDKRDTVVKDAIIGNGKRETGEIGINGVTVELVEIIEKDGKEQEYVWQRTTTGSSKVDVRQGGDGTSKEENNGLTNHAAGQYKFIGYIPGDYFVKFRYGNTDATILTKANGGVNVVSYNGQDFKSTTYTTKVEKDGEFSSAEEAKNIDYTKNEERYLITESDSDKNNYSDARDVWGPRTDASFYAYANDNKYNRQTVNAYSSNNVTNHIATVLASPYLAKDIANANKNELITNTQMMAVTGRIKVDTEYTRTETDSDGATGTNKKNNNQNGKYALQNIDFGLVERPKAQLELNQKVVRARLVLANGNVAFDSKQTADSLTWNAKDYYDLEKKMSQVSSAYMYDNYYNSKNTDNNKDRYAYRDQIKTLVDNVSNTGLLQGIVDQELMKGAVLTLQYELEVKNVGEVDYSGEKFYYTGSNTGLNKNVLVTTKANVVVDYMSNNLQYNENDNKMGDKTVWSVLNKTNVISDTKISSDLSNSINKYNTILKTTRFAVPLSEDGTEYPEDGNLTPTKSSFTKNSSDRVALNLTLSTTLDPGSSGMDNAYTNIAEIVETSNTAGRRMAYSIVGNQDPSQAPAEVDTSKAENVLILPPFGNGYIYIGAAVGLAALVLLAGGIVLIKKKILKK